MKPKFRLEEHTGDYVMHCPEKWMAEKFCAFLDKAGRKWLSGRRYTNESNWWEHRENSCYKFNMGQCGSIDYYKNCEYIVLEFDDFDWNEETTMTKSDLKVGYVVKFRDGTLGMVMPDDEYGLITVNNDGTWINLSNVDDNMCFKTLNSSSCDIMEVYGRSKLPAMSIRIDEKHRDLLWKRKEAKKMTVSEISEIVSKYLGTDVEVEVVKEH